MSFSVPSYIRISRTAVFNSIKPDSIEPVLSSVLAIFVIYFDFDN